MIEISVYGQTPMESILARTSAAADEDVRRAVAEIMGDVRARGDAALSDLCERFDGTRPASLEVSPEEMDRAMESVPAELLRVMERATTNIRRFHEAQRREGFVMTGEDGLTVGQRTIPLRRVGVYAPGGRAAYPSTVLMCVVPARVAGCDEVVVATPPRKDGSIDPAVLVAARVAGADRVFKIGGAGAVAALTWGTESVPRVDKIVGPGNAYVAEAKRQVFGVVGIDTIAGPSEILIVADASAEPRWVAADMLSQAEHDPMATAVLLTTSREQAEAVRAELVAQLPELEREEIARASLEANGKIVVVPSLSVALDVADALAPEHLELCVEDPIACLGRVRDAGSVFLGRWCPEALGDYLSGANHTLPTGGAARFASPLSVDDFVKRSQFIACSPEAMRELAGDVALFARHEGLGAHAASAMMRMEGGRP